MDPTGAGTQHTVYTNVQNELAPYDAIVFLHSRTTSSRTTKKMIHAVCNSIASLIGDELQPKIKCDFFGDALFEACHVVILRTNERGERGERFSKALLDDYRCVLQEHGMMASKGPPMMFDVTLRDGGGHVFVGKQWHRCGGVEDADVDTVEIDLARSLSMDNVAPAPSEGTESPS